MPDLPIPRIPAASPDKTKRGTGVFGWGLPDRAYCRILVRRGEPDAQVRSQAAPAMKAATT